MIKDPTVYVVFIFYALLMLSVGVVFSRLTRNEDDFLRGGAKAAWWMVGISIFMSNFSAWVFTGAASAVFEAGWSVMWIFWGNVAGYFICFLWLAPWFRQMRIMAQPEVLVKRYGNHLGQFYTWVFLPTAPIYPAITLLGLGIFVSTFFGIPMEPTIIVLGSVVVVYSIAGGVWATMATDFLQGVVLIPFTLLIALLCLHQLGGFSGMLEMIDAQGLSNHFSFIQPTGQFEGNKYNWVWALAAFLNVIKGFISLGSAAKFRTVKDGRDARKAALMASGLFLFGSLIWFIPPAYARLLFADEVLATAVGNPAEASYAVAAIQVLPTALLGVLIIAMLSATMSSMDTTINGVTGGLVKVAYPGLCRVLKREPTKNGKKLLMMSRVIVFLYGISIVGLAIKFHRDGRGVFDLMLGFMAFLTATGIPILWGIIIKRVPPWAPYVTIGLGMIPAIIGVFSGSLFGEAWNFQTKFFVNISFGSLVFFSTTFWWKGTSTAYKEKVHAFFREMKTPVDVEKEIGITSTTDCSQLRIVGAYALILSAFFAILAALPQSANDRLICAALAGMVFFIGIIFYFLGRRSHQRLKAAAREANLISS
ncbi:MAG: sodium:solute symporter family transporter [Oceanipulchritudo sp.]